MLEQLLTSLVLGFCAAGIGFTHSIILWNDNTPLNGFYSFLVRLESEYPMLAKPLGACILCFSGQVGLWASILGRGGYAFTDILGHLSAAGAGVTFAWIIAKLHDRWES